MIKAAITGLLIFVFIVLIANVQLPTDPENLHAACVGIFFVGVLTGLVTVAMHLNEIREV